MSKVYKVSNVEEAVVLASKFQDEGKYDWFRGQAKDWPPHSSLYRLKDKQELIPVVTEDYNEFINWAEKKEELKYLLEPANVHQLEAVLQHYGFPTCYIDFTTEPSVAGFFACDTKTPPTDGYSCIYCLNTEHLFSFWKDVKQLGYRAEVNIEQINVDVSNLWRLQAQRGVFLYANYNWEIDYPLDKIVFPYTGYPSYPTRDMIYPEHESALEVLLDEFFDKQRSRKAISKILPFMDAIEYLVPFENGYHKPVFKESIGLSVLPSWNEKDWGFYKIENFHETTGSFQKISLRDRKSESQIKDVIAYGIRQMARSNKSLRNKAVNWIVEDAPVELNVVKVNALLARVWNGMRRLPFTDEEISIACGNTVYLYMKGKSNTNQIDIFQELFGEGIIVGFSIKEGNGSRGFASRKSIMSALGYKFSDLLVDEAKSMADDPIALFSVIYNPKLMFDFDSFRKLFAQEVIPCQILMGNDYIIFNPNEVYMFGNP